MLLHSWLMSSFADILVLLFTCTCPWSPGDNGLSCMMIIFVLPGVVGVPLECLYGFSACGYSNCCDVGTIDFNRRVVQVVYRSLREACFASLARPGRDLCFHLFIFS